LPEAGRFPFLILGSLNGAKKWDKWRHEIVRNVGFFHVAGSGAFRAIAAGRTEVGAKSF